MESTKKSFNELIQGTTPVLVDFHATWCGPCKMMSPIIEQFSTEMGSAVRVIKIDVDKNQAAAATYQVQGVPTLVLFKEGKIVWRQSGVVQAHTLKQVVQPYIVNAAGL